MSTKSKFALACCLIAVIIGAVLPAHAHAPGSDNMDSDPQRARPAASAFVPVDSWVYAPLDRLAALGYANTAFLGLRPWTREECARLVDEAEQIAENRDAPADVRHMLTALHTEFSAELEPAGADTVYLDSVYTRTLAIQGRPLADSYHFGQSVVNDFGRPYAEGLNQLIGVSGRGQFGRFTFYVRGEYQHAPGIAPLSQSVREDIALADGTPVQPAAAVPARNQFRLLDTYVAVDFLGMQFSVGKQSLWWGPGESGAMILSSNAEPFPMLRLTRTSPRQLPSFLRYLGPMRFDSFFGRLAGHSFPPRPFFYGQKISFKPTPNLEFGFSRTAVFAGEGVTPLTFSTFFHSFFSTSSGTAPGFDLRNNPGARHANFDFAYRLPLLRRRVTLYTDSAVHDDVSPVAAPRRAAINPGIYVSRLPKLPKFDLRVEAVSTDPPTSRSTGGKFIYWEGIYRDAYTNKGTLLGNWIGREGKGGEAWLSYWLGPSSRIQVGYRRAKIARDFVPGGATQNDVFAASSLSLSAYLELDASLQYERWTIPALAKDTQTNVVTMLQLTWFPKFRQSVR